jgi:hypothetical protein
MKLRTLAPLGLLLLAAAAFADTAVYDLDAKNAPEIAKAIQATLTARCATIPSTVLTVSPSMCHVELLPTNQLLVEAPAPAQSQIAVALKAIAARNATATPAPRITLQYWVLYGDPGKPDAADASLKPLDAVLQQLKRVHGELGFSVADNVSITTQSGASGSAHGGALNIDHTIRASGDDLNLLTRLQFAPRPLLADLNVNLSVNVAIKRGEFVVLGERGAVEIGHDDASKGQVELRQKAGMLFFVVHWQ